MTVGELRQTLLYMDPEADVLLNDGVHFMRRCDIARVEVDEANPVLELPPIVLIGQEPPDIPWDAEPYREECEY